MRLCLCAVLVFGVLSSYVCMFGLVFGVAFAFVYFVVSVFVFYVVWACVFVFLLVPVRFLCMRSYSCLLIWLAYC